MSNLVTDTHGLIWYLEDNPRLGIKANQAFEACDQGGDNYLRTDHLFNRNNLFAGKVPNSFHSVCTSGFRTASRYE